MNPLTAEQIAEMDRLEREATPGPWAFESHGREGGYGVGVLYDGDDHTCEGEQTTGECVVAESVAPEVDRRANAALIAAMRNALRALLDEREALRAERDEWKRNATERVVCVGCETARAEGFREGLARAAEEVITQYPTDDAKAEKVARLVRALALAPPSEPPEDEPRRGALLEPRPDARDLPCGRERLCPSCDGLLRANEEMCPVCHVRPDAPGSASNSLRPDEVTYPRGGK